MEYGSMTETEKQMLVSEVNLLRDLKHENIVRLVGIRPFHYHLLHASDITCALGVTSAGPQ